MIISPHPRQLPLKPGVVGRRIEPAGEGGTFAYGSFGRTGRGICGSLGDMGPDGGERISGDLTSEPGDLCPGPLGDREFWRGGSSRPDDEFGGDMRGPGRMLAGWLF